MTVTQILQFVSGVIFTTIYMFYYFEDIKINSDGYKFNLTIQQGCTGDLWAVLGMYFVNNSFLILFIKWYIDNYSKENKKPAGVSRAKKD